MSARPERRAVVTGVAAALVLALGSGGYLAALDVRLHRALDRATSVATGTVVEAGIGDEDDVRVRWRDASGAAHQKVFCIYDTDAFEAGDTFDVRYDPARPASQPFPADPEETCDVDDLEVPLGLVVALSVGLLLGWAYRGLAFWRTSRRPAAPARVTGLRGTRVSADVYGETTWLEIDDRAWQRVMHHPAAERLRDDTVLVHGDTTGRRRVVVELPDTTRLVPVGRLRQRPPKTTVLARREQTDQDALWLFPARATVPPPVSGHRGVLLVAATGAAVGTGMALIFGATAGIPAFVVGVASLLVAVRALVGGDAS